MSAQWAIVINGTPATFRSLGFEVAQAEGAGLPGVDPLYTEYASLPGAGYQRSKVRPRVLTLRGAFIAQTLAALHSARAAVLDAVVPDRVAGEAVEIRYTIPGGATYAITGYYAGGLELMELMGFNEMSVPIRFICTDPYWLATAGDSEGPHAALPSVLTASTVYRRAATGVWAALGQLGSLAEETRALAVAPNGDIYAGGTWTMANGATTLVGYVARWASGGSTWGSLGSGTKGTNGSVNAIAVSPAGIVYIAGTFTTAGGSTVNRIVKYDPTTDTLSAIGGATKGTNGEVRALAYDALNDVLYLGGDFTTAGGVTVNRIAKYTPGTDTFSAMTATPGVNGAVYALAVLPAATLQLYAVGAFTSAGGVACNRVALWDGTAFSEPGTPPFTSTVKAIALGADRASLIAVSAGPGMAARWDLSAWATIGGLDTAGSGAGDDCAAVAVDPDDQVWIGTLDGAPALRRHDGASWGSGEFYSTSDALALAWDADGLLLAGIVYASPATEFSQAVTVAGSAAVAPVITLESSGRICLSVRNATTGAIIRFPDQASGFFLATTETVVIDCAARTITSNLRGDLSYLMLDGSDLASFTLAAGANDIRTCTGASLIYITVDWTDRYWSLDG